MAQPLFEEHPLEEYFRQTGEFAEPMPGISPDFAPEPEDPLDLDDPSELADIQLPQFVVSVLQVSMSTLLSLRCCRGCAARSVQTLMLFGPSHSPPVPTVR
ncbi:hypothetical protein BD413DRAFT_574300 [Trametes elegans]|nr:hypothetical protein BD413DRAFT_574300 [Trametes elegans]